jgi:aspartyl-tRNA(Asn)/glutamyl-tRNA(Gln) amidotransferase subunit B
MSEQATKVLAIVGLEIHVELATETKMFCRCRNRFGDPPNTNVCPVCIGMPGVLPVMNSKAVEYSLKVGQALNCELPSYSKWDRKSYYYPDLPKNYQISQYDLPLCKDGYLDVPLPDGSSKRIRVLRAHLEEDAGKNIHDNPAHTGVDLNRAGVPLLEIVSQPDMNTPQEALSFAREMQRLVRWLGVSEANMQMGHMRFEPNINLHITRGGTVYKTPIVEVKNLNSFKALEGAVTHELKRQYAQWLEDPEGFSLDRKGKQNRGWDDQRNITVFQREKEEAHDYRYFPEPDLPAVVVDDAWRESIRASIGELPLARRERFIKQHQLGSKEAEAMIQDADTGNLLDDATAMGAPPRRVVNLMLGRMSAAANEKGCALGQLGVSAAQLSQLAIMLEEGKLNATAGDKIIDHMIANGGSPLEIAGKLNLLAESNTAAVEQWVDQAIAANPDPAQQVRSGDKKAKQAFGFLVGQVMRISGGKAPPSAVKELLESKLSAK